MFIASGKSGPLPIRSIWQHESFDHELRRDESLRQKAEYVCANPLRRGLVKTGEEYPWIWREWVEGQRRT